jgi:hypothetical protein
VGRLNVRLKGQSVRESLGNLKGLPAQPHTSFTHLPRGAPRRRLGGA